MSTHILPVNKDTNWTHIIDLRSDQKYALAINKVSGSIDSLALRIDLLNLETKEFVNNIVKSSGRDTRPEARAIFGQDGKVYGIGDRVGPGWRHPDTFFYDYIYDVVHIQSEWTRNFRLPVDPISPDGKNYIMLKDNEFVLIDFWSHNLEYVPIQQSSIKDFQLHKNIQAGR